MKKIAKTQVMSIVHGKSELAICSSVKSNLRLKHEIYADKKGAKSIQVTSLMNILNNTTFSSYESFTKRYDDIECKDKKLIGFKLFIIMDLDDCNEEMKNRFKNKEMFAKHWLYEYIVAIYNNPNLEQTMKDIKIPIKKNEKKKYFLIFPTNHGDLDIQKATDFSQKLKKSKNSNLYKYIDYCLSLVD